MFRFRRPVLDDAEMLLAWRTQPDITRFMYTDLESPSVERQRQWLTAMNEKANYSHFIITHSGRDIGYLSYSDIDRVHGHCSSGSYVVSADDRRKLAGFLHTFIMDHCFYTLGMNKLVNYFMDGNDGVIRIQRVLKAREVGILRQHIFKGGRYHDVHVYETTRADWETHRRAFPREVTLPAFDL